MVDADITSYFDQIPHKLMQERLLQDPAIDPAALHVLNQWIKAEVWDGHELTGYAAEFPKVLRFPRCWLISSSLRSMSPLPKAIAR